MKIRQGFVSNSSSSSFLIYGVCLEGSSEDLLSDAVKAELKGAYEKEKMADSETPTWKEWVEEIIRNEEFSASTWPKELYSTTGDPNVGEDVHYVGISPSQCKDNETMGQFKERVRKMVKGIFKVEDKDFGFLSGCWFDG